MGGSSYQDLIVWQKAMDLVEAVYKETRGFPREEMYALVSQMRRAAVSIPSNIAEGHGQGTLNNFRRYLQISMGSLKELETQILIAERLNYLDHPNTQSLLKCCDEIGKMLTGLCKSVTKSN